MRPAEHIRKLPPFSAWALVAALAGGLIALPDTVEAVIGPAVLATVLLALIQPLVVLPLVLVAVPFGGVARDVGADTATELSVGAVEVLVALIGLAWLARGARLHELRPRLGLVSLAILAMIGLALISIGYAQEQSLAVKESLKWLELLVVLLVVLDLVRTPRAVRWLIGAMMAAGAAEAVYGAYQFATDTGPSTFALQGALRAFGHFDQPNPFAGYLTMILPLAICMALNAGNPTAFRWFSFGAAGVLVAGIGLSQSRGAWLGGAIAFASLLLLWGPSTRRLLVPGAVGAALVFALAISGLLPAAILDRLFQTIEYFGIFDVQSVQVTSENWAVVERMAHWQAGWYMFLDHPWLGVGAGNYPQAYSAYFVGSWREALGHAHNYYLNILAELGLLGGGVLLLLLGAALRQLGRTLARSTDHGATFWRAVLAGAFGGMVVFCVHNLFDSLFVHSVSVQVGIILGLGLVAVDKLERAEP